MSKQEGFIPAASIVWFVFSIAGIATKPLWQEIGVTLPNSTGGAGTSTTHLYCL